jgi:NADP-dependent aldehyde dehydrogenase
MTSREAPSAGTARPFQFLYHSATEADVNHAAQAAASAFSLTRDLSGADRAAFLRAIAYRLDANRTAIAEQAHRETALPMPRLEGEVGRTSGQLRLFATLVEEGSWVDARIDHADPERKPLPKPDIRSMLRPLGPVVVFGASNFPLAFSVAGGDTAAALAAGCPVLVKAHPAHPATSEMVGRIIGAAAEETGMPNGIFALLFGEGHELGLSLVRHPAVKAVAFTGSRRGGCALMVAAAARPEPVPVFAEMSSINPVVITPGALQARSEAIATGLHGAVTLGVGQFCTNPGLVLLPAGEAGDAFLEGLSDRFRQTPLATMLTDGIFHAYESGLTKLANLRGVTVRVLPTPSESMAGAALFETSAATFQDSEALMEEVFGPSTVVVRYGNLEEAREVISGLEGQLTATLHAQDEEISQGLHLLAAMESRSGRVILNGYPTGVEVAPAMVHGGPFPATSDGQSSSVGTRAITRFVRPVCYQNFPESALPLELRESNPLVIERLVDGKRGVEASHAAG